MNDGDGQQYDDSEGGGGVNEKLLSPIDNIMDMDESDDVDEYDEDEDDSYDVKRMEEEEEKEDNYRYLEDHLRTVSLSYI